MKMHMVNAFPINILFYLIQKFPSCLSDILYYNYFIIIISCIIYITSKSSQEKWNNSNLYINILLLTCAILF